MGFTAYRSLKHNRRLYKCDGPDCGLSREPWGKTWISYYSIQDLEDEPENVLTFCSIECANRYVDTNPESGVPRPTKNDLKSDAGRALQRLADAPLTRSGEFDAIDFKEAKSD